MAIVARGIDWFNRTAMDQPIWLRALAPPVFALIGLDLARHRGWALGLVFAAVGAALGLAMALRPHALTSWSRAHPKLDGAAFGPILAAGVAVWGLPWFWCLAAGVAGLAFGSWAGFRRARRLSEPGWQ